MISSEGGAEAQGTREKLDTLNKRWEEVLGKTRDKQLDLEDSLREVSLLLKVEAIHQNVVVNLFIYWYVSETEYIYLFICLFIISLELGTTPILFP